ncbi:hypothetical protein D9611_012975 [Ephemerocybe angulata]|uniref:Uncharacterized protein n=1 Tax=Ephemerocybe angulata TaxID=980116 RepID=A0A8H5C3X3_9AGAR|nr:hypothetical protein D9611_012975 [Tulosesus angulatus]
MILPPPIDATRSPSKSALGQIPHAPRPLTSRPQIVHMRAHRASWRFQSTNLCIFTAKPRDYAAIVTARDGQWDLGWEGVHGESKPKVRHHATN